MSHYEPGDYKARIVRQGFSESKAKATPFFFIEIEPFEALGPNTMPEVVYKRTIDWYFTDKAGPNSIEKLRALGWAGSKLTELQPDSPNHHSFVGQEVHVYNKPDDAGYDKFDLARGGTGGAGTEARSGVAEKLDKLFGKSLMASKPKVVKAPAKAVAAPAEDEVEADPIPF